MQDVTILHCISQESSSRRKPRRQSISGQWLSILRISYIRNIDRLPVLRSQQHFRNVGQLQSLSQTEITLEILMPNLFDLCHKLEHDRHTPHDATALISEMMNSLLRFGGWPSSSLLWRRFWQIQRQPNLDQPVRCSVSAIRTLASVGSHSRSSLNEQSLIPAKINWQAGILHIFRHCGCRSFFVCKIPPTFPADRSSAI